MSMPALLALLLAPTAGAADDLAVDPWVDLPVLLATGGTTVALQFLVDPPWVAVVHEEPRLAWDARWAGQPEIDGEGPDLVSDFVGFYPAFALPVALGAWGASRPPDGRARVARAGAWAAVGLEVVAVNTTLTDLLKLSVRRPRPYTHGEAWQAEYDAAVAAGEPVDVDAQLSFPSGHTSTAGAWTFALAHTWNLTHDAPWYLEALPYAGAAGLTAWTGVLRVRAHVHFPTDVLVGGLLGAGVGVLVPELHRAGRIAPSVARTADGTPLLGISAPL